MDKLIGKVCKDLKADLKIDDSDTESINMLESKIAGAMNEVKFRRSYPLHFTESQITKDLERHYSAIRELALYDYNQEGTEGQISHSENGTSRTWKSRNECLQGVFAFANCF